MIKNKTNMKEFDKSLMELGNYDNEVVLRPVVSEIEDNFQQI